MIKFENIYKTFASRGGNVQALSDISLEVKKGDIFGVIGFSGAGKSTLIRMVNALEKPTSGRVFVEGKDISSYRGRELRNFRHNIGIIFQHVNLLENKSVFENIALPLVLLGEKKAVIRERVKELLTFVELEEKENSYPSELSGGQKQRVGIARALASKPSILLCDEATSALDPKTTEAILALLQKVNRELNITILMITHQMNVIQQICNKVAVLERGKIIEQGSVIDVFGSPKSETTRGFVRTVINDQLPQPVKEYLRSYSGPQKVYRLRFDGSNADNPVMADAIAASGARISIICGIVTVLEGKVIGFQTAQITGSEEEIDSCLKYLDSRGIKRQEVDFREEI